MPKTITVLTETVSYSNRAFDVVDQNIELPSGLRVVHSTVLHRGAVVILPIANDGKLIAIRQYRHSIKKTLLEFPAGTLSEGEEPIACAKREISEETGYGAKKWVDLGTMYPAPGFCNEIQHTFVARDLYPNTLEGDPDEVIEVAPLSVAEVEAAIASGELCDCKSISIFYKAKMRGLF